MTQPSATCRRCRAPVSASEARGLCPVCLLETSLGVEEEGDPDVIGVDAAWLQRQGMTERPLNSEGARRFGDYELLEEIGRGGMGVIYRAVQVSLKRTVAVKTILTGPLASPDFVQRFQTEAHAAAVLDHPNIVPIYEVGDHQGQPYYSMPLIAGRNLAEALKQDGPLPARQAAKLLATVARAVHYAHQRGVLHRDLKPANILLDADGKPHVTDFGLAKLLEEDDGLTLTQAALGTPNYMAPEQADGKLVSLTTAADTYSLGAILFEVLTGQRLFAAPTPLATIARARDQQPPRPSTICLSISRDLEVICLKCLEKDPVRRYASAGELADELDRFFNGEPIYARPVGPAGRTWRWCRRKPVLAAMIASIVVLLLAVTVVSAVAAIRVGAEVRRAERNAKELRLNLYVADMNLAYQAIEHNNLGLARELIRKYLPKDQQAQVGPAQLPEVEAGEDLRGWEWRYLWRRCQGDSLATLDGHTSFATCAAFSPDGNKLATASFDQTVRIWDAATKQTVRRLTGFANALQRNSVAFSPDGALLAVADGSDLHVFETKTWIKLRTLPNRSLPGRMFSLPIAFSPNGKRLSCNARGEIRSWDTSSWEQVEAPQRSPVGEFGCLLTYAGDGRRYATAVADGVEIWDLASTSPSKLVVGPLRWPSCIVFSPDGRFLAAVGIAGEVVVWDAEKGTEMARWSVDSMFPLTVAFSRDGKRLATGGADQIIRLWEIEQGRLVVSMRGHHNEIWSLAFAPDGRTLVSSSKDGTARLWSATPEIAAVAGLPGGNPLQFSADGRILTMIGANSVVEGFDLRSGNPVHHFHFPDGLIQPERVAVSPDSRLLALVTTNGTAQIWDRSSGERTAECNLDRTPVWPVLAFSPDNGLLAISCGPLEGGGGGWTVVWDLQRRERRALPGGDVYRPAFSPDGRIMATGLGSNVQLWSVPGLLPLATLRGHRWTINSLAFSRDGAVLASAGRDNDIRLWEVATGREKVRLSGHQTGLGLRAAAFSLDGKTLASGESSLVKLWNVATGKELLTINGLGRHGGHPMFSPDGNTLLVGGSQFMTEPAPIELHQAPSLAEIEVAERANGQSR